jgi:fluoroquinolone transport system permease protein
MRMVALFSGDIRFQIKYGFYFLYLVFTVLYVGLLFALPAAWREKAALLMVFSDPAAMGLYFMGSIILFEKGSRTLNSLAVSPVTPREYTFSKLLSISVISTLVGAVISFAGGGASMNAGFFAGVFLCSCLFSAIGLIVAAKSMTLNAFILSTIPFELVINVPAIAYLFGWNRSWLLVHPGVCMIELCQNGRYSLPAFLVLFIWTVLAVLLAVNASSKMYRTMGGMKL